MTRRGLQLSTVLHRAGRTVGAPVLPPADPSRGVLVERRAAEATGHLTAAGRARCALTIAAAGSDRERVVLQRVLAATRSAAAVDGLAVAWRSLGDAGRAAVADPTRLGTAARQQDGTTCGAATLTMLAALGDPVLALWLTTGRLVPGWRPPGFVGADGAALDRLAAAPPAARFRRVHRVLQRRTSRASGHAPPWPASLGTPPWAAAREARFAGVRFTHRVVDDTDAEHLVTTLGRVGAALDAGVPVPLYSGGDTTGGLGRAVPRHVVLAVSRSRAALTVWEPASGRTHGLPLPPVGGGVLPALGGWPHLAWVVLPVLPALPAPPTGRGGSP